jgi:hypothetical protein
MEFTEHIMEGSQLHTLQLRLSSYKGLHKLKVEGYGDLIVSKV